MCSCNHNATRKTHLSANTVCVCSCFLAILLASWLLGIGAARDKATSMVFVMRHMCFVLLPVPGLVPIFFFSDDFINFDLV